jgi:magnesium transporter
VFPSRVWPPPRPRSRFAWVISVFVHENGVTRCADRVEPRWLDPASPSQLWVDLSAPSPDESRQILVDTFGFHPLSVEDAMSEIHHPKVETYDAYLYLILHGIAFEHREHRFQTRDVDFFLGRSYLVTVHDGRSRSVARLRDLCDKHPHILGEGPVALLHRIVDSMVDHYRPEIESFEHRIDALEHAAALGGRQSMVREILALKRDLSSLRRVVIPQRDAVGRLARREFPVIADEMAYRFRDVYDHLVRFSEEAFFFQDRVTGILDVHLSAVSNRLNQIVKVLTVMSTIFLPLTVLTGMYGMNVPLPHLPGGDAVQFWWILGLMLALAGVMLAIFRLKDWI